MNSGSIARRICVHPFQGVTIYPETLRTTSIQLDLRFVEVRVSSRLTIVAEGCVSDVTG